MDLDLHSLASLLQSCNTNRWIHQGRQVHLLFLKKGLINSALTFGNRLIQMYVRCGSLSDAWKVFKDMPERNCFSWNTIIEGYMKSGNKERSLQLFDSMPHKNEYSWNVVVSGFAKAGELQIAQSLFNDMPKRNAVAWNSMIHCYAQNGYAREAMKLFKDLSSDPFEVLYRDTFVLTTVIGACSDLEALDCGKQIHARILIDEVECDSVLSSSLIHMYGKCGDPDSANHALNMLKEPDDFSLSALISGYANCGRMNDARRIFGSKSDPCVVLWNSIISGYVYNNEEIEALIFFNQMRRNGVQEDSSTLASVLSASSNLGTPGHGKQMHTYGYKVGLIDDVIVASALVDAYSKCGSPYDACKLFSELKHWDTILLNSMITVYSNCGKIEDAKFIFKMMPNKSLISWNSMIVALSQNGCAIEALDLLCEMSRLKLRMDKFSLASAISACASISSLELGEQLFARATVIGLESDQIICTSLVDLYCKCGFIDDGRKLFDGMIKFDEISWNAMLMGYATNGFGIEALNLFAEMRQVGVRPTDITFTAVLSACDHCGLVEEGHKWFYAMKSYYHIDPGIEHYSCMVDLLARAGRLYEAWDFIEKMPEKPDEVALGALLGACHKRRNVDISQRVVQLLLELEPLNSGNYVISSKIFANLKRWDDSARMRVLMRQRGVMKTPGCSWIEVETQLHEFHAGDGLQHNCREIYELMDLLYEDLKREGYIPMIGEFAEQGVEEAMLLQRPMS